MKLHIPESTPTRGNSPLKTAKPLFIGSIPIAASSSYNNLQTAGDLN
jgi:hypothetical protein